MERVSENRGQAVILLHEIYGVNRFITEQCQKFREAGYEVFCPDLLHKAPFSYEKSAEAYDYFMTNIGFDRYAEISACICRLRNTYDAVFIAGFSAGATLAWRCCENPMCSGIIACYGSRIRDYTDLTPACPALILLAREDSFDVRGVAGRLREKKLVSVIECDAGHGFLDPYSGAYDSREAERAGKQIARFLNDCTSRTAGGMSREMAGF